MVDPRYSRQSILRVFETGEYSKIRESTVAVIGVGGTGSMAADLFTRIGVKKLILVDRDYVSISNLHRQVLYDDLDVGEPKVECARRKLEKINPDVEVEALNMTFDASNALEITGKSDLLFDGTDNFTSRLIINDACVKTGKPWVYTSAIETYGEAKAIIPGESSCMSCYVTMPSQRQPVCSEVGVFPSVPNMVSSFAFTIAVKILIGRSDPGDLYFFDVWSGQMQKLRIKRNPNCRTCSKKEYDFLADRYSSLGIRPLI